MATRTKALAQAYSPQQYAELAKAYAAPQTKDQTMTDADLEELFSRRNVPVYSAGQGVAEAGGKIAEAYLRRKAREKTAEQQAGDYKSLAQAITGAGAPMSVHQANSAGGYADLAQQAMPQNQTSNAGVDPMQMQPYKMANPETFNQAPASDNQRLAALMQGVPDRLKLQALPVVQQQIAAQKPQMLAPLSAGQVLPQQDPTTGKITTAFAAPAAPLKPGAPHVVGANLVGEDGKVLFTDPATEAHLKAETDAARAKTKSSVDDIPEGVTGPAVLELLKPTERASVQAIVDGDQPLPSRTANPTGQRIAGLVSLVDPTYNAQRLKVKSDFASGQTAKNIKAIGTAIQHIDSLDKSMAGLDNYGGLGTILNAPKNYIAGKTGKPGINNVDISANAVAGELENAFRGSGSSITGIHEWRKTISPNLSPEQRAGAKQTALDLLDGRMEAIANQWNQVMPQDKQREPLDFLSPDQKAVYAKLKGQTDTVPAAVAAPSGVDPSLWSHMTPEEQALWKK